MMSTKNLHVIKASAGAGKTYTLAKTDLLFHSGRAGF